MTRVLHLTRDHPPHEKGGLSFAVDWLAHVAAGAGHGQYVVSFDRWRPRADDGALPLAPGESPAPLVQVRRVRAPDHLRALAAEVRDFAPQLLVVHDALLWPWLEALGPPASNVAPRWLWVHVLHAELNRLRGVAETASATAQSQALCAADAVVVAGPAGAALASHHHGAALPLLRLPVSLRGLAGAAARTQTSVASGPRGEPADASVAPPGAATRGRRPSRTVVATGRLDLSKGTADLAAALPQVLRSDPAAAALVIGGVPGNRAAQRRWTTQLAAACGTDAGRLRVTGWQTPDAVDHGLKRAAVAVFASHAETLGLGLLQALAAGAPVVATEVSGHRDAVDGEALPGLRWVPRAAPAALAAATLAALHAPDPALDRAARAAHAAAFDAAAQGRWLRALDEL